MATTAGRPPLWRDVRVLAWAFQLLVVAAVVAVLWWLTDNYRTNASRRGFATDWAFLDQPAQFPIANSTFRQTQPIKDALVDRAGEHAAPRRSPASCWPRSSAS